MLFERLTDYPRQRLVAFARDTIELVEELRGERDLHDRIRHVERSPPAATCPELIGKHRAVLG